MSDWGCSFLSSGAAPFFKGICNGSAVRVRAVRRVPKARTPGNAGGNDRKRREWMQRRWPDLDVELGRLGYVLACNGLFHQAPRSKGALIKAARAGAQ